MKRVNFYKLVLVGCNLLLFATCSQVDPPVFDNPHDPVNPNFELPLATITSHTNGQTVNTTTLTINWNGRYPEGVYAYKLEGVDEVFCDWQNEREATYRYLDEGTYTYYVKEKTGTYEQTEPTSLTFTVNALQQTSLILMRWNNRVSANTESYVEVWLEEVTHFKGITTQLQINENVTITQIVKNSGPLESEGGRWLQITNSLDEINHSFVITFDGILLGGNTNGFSGSAPLCRIYFKAIGDTQLTLISDSTQVRDIANKHIEVFTIRDGIIDVY